MGPRGYTGEKGERGERGFKGDNCIECSIENYNLTQLNLILVLLFKNVLECFMEKEIKTPTPIIDIILNIRKNDFSNSIHFPDRL
jgi:hypothetical protein